MFAVRVSCCVRLWVVGAVICGVRGCVGLFFLLVFVVACFSVAVVVVQYTVTCVFSLVLAVFYLFFPKFVGVAVGGALGQVVAFVGVC